MRIDDLRIAIVGLAFIVIGLAVAVLTFLTDSLVYEHGSLVAGLIDVCIFSLPFVIAGIGFLYVAFSKRFRTEP